MKIIKNWRIFESEQNLLNIVQDEGRTLQQVGNSNYFKDNMFDPWAPSKLRDSIENVDVFSVLTYETPSEEKLKKYGEYKLPEYDRYSTGYPIAIRYNNKIILLDGHHRLELAKRSGQKTIPIAIKNLN